MMAKNTSPENQMTEAFESYADAIFRLCYFRVFNRETAQELTQETFMRTWRYLSENEIDNIKAFLYRTAHNLIIDYSRKKHDVSLEKIQEEQGFDMASTDQKIAEQMDEKYILQLIKKLPEPYRTAIILRYIEQLSVKEIAKMSNITENLASVQIYRGLKQLKQLLPT